MKNVYFEHFKDTRGITLEVIEFKVNEIIDMINSLVKETKNDVIRERIVSEYLTSNINKEKKLIYKIQEDYLYELIKLIDETLKVN